MNIKMQTVLIVDDDHNIVELLEASLASEGWQTHTATTGNEAIRVFKTEPLDLVLLDLKLPDINGLEICRKIRESSEVPVVAVSAVNDAEEKIKCLDCGADDYITKPFTLEVLQARIRAVIRRKGLLSSQSSFKFENLEIDFTALKFTKDGIEVRLTRIEFSLLNILAQNPGTVLTFKQLIEKLWGRNSIETEHNLEVHIYNLRKKIETDSFRIANVYGTGFRLDINGHNAPPTFPRFKLECRNPDDQGSGILL